MEYNIVKPAHISATYYRTGVGQILVVKRDPNIDYHDLIQHHDTKLSSEIFMVTGDFTNDNMQPFQHLIVKKIGDLKNTTPINIEAQYRDVIWVEYNPNIDKYSLLSNDGRVYIVNEVIGATDYMALHVSEVR